MSTDLTISEIERLAKAGVAVNLCGITPIPDAQTVPEHHMPKALADLIWDRWRRTKYTTIEQLRYHWELPFQLFASEHGDKAYVFVQPNDQPPFIIEDERCIFPSDALMAKLSLLEKK